MEVRYARDMRTGPVCRRSRRWLFTSVGGDRLRFANIQTCTSACKSRVRTARVRTARVRTARVRTARARTARVRTARIRSGARDIHREMWSLTSTAITIAFSIDARVYKNSSISRDKAARVHLRTRWSAIAPAAVRAEIANASFAAQAVIGGKHRTEQGCFRAPRRTTAPRFRTRTAT